MSEELTNFFVLFGILFSFVIVGFILIVMFDFIKQKNDELKNYHRIKHRFDKPPLADCYCIDCKSYNRENGRCYRLNRSTADNWFCWNAEPIDVEAAKQLEKKDKKC
jgi:hypothetical protein